MNKINCINEKNLLHIEGVYNSIENHIIFTHNYIEDYCPLDMLIVDADEVKKNYYNIMINIGEGLKQLLKLDLHHNNLKPSNVFITNNFNVLLADYLHNSLYSLDDIPFSNYLSPEQLIGEESDNSDIWSYGCLLYYLFTGEDLFPSESVSKLLYDMRNLDYECFYDIDNCDEEMCDLLTQMIVPLSESRMSLESVVNTIKSIYSF